jgi:GH24 family phage-related lysozyme (muramidase)
MYLDSKGIPTIGIGFNLKADGAQQKIEALGLTYKWVLSGHLPLNDAQIDTLFQASLADAIKGARGAVSNFDHLPDPVRAAVIDMVFNMGATKFAGFYKAIAALQAENYNVAAAQFTNSAWFREVKTRAFDVVRLIKEGASVQRDYPERTQDLL